MGLLKNLGGQLASGLMGNLSEVSPESLMQEYGAYLMDDVGESNATLKRVYLYENQIVLQAENPKYSPWVYTGEDMNKVRIIGKAVAFLSEVQ